MKTIGSIGHKVLKTSILCAGVLFAVASFGQVTAPGFVAKPMQVSPISGVEDKEIAFINVSMEPGSSSPRHTHPGDCYGAVIEGSIELVVEGQDAKRFEAGQAWNNPRGPVHYFKNVGDKPAHLINVLIYDKGKPRTVVEKPAEK